MSQKNKIITVEARIVDAIYNPIDSEAIINVLVKDDMKKAVRIPMSSMPGYTDENMKQFVESILLRKKNNLKMNIEMRESELEG